MTRPSSMKSARKAWPFAGTLVASLALAAGLSACGVTAPFSAAPRLASTSKNQPTRLARTETPTPSQPVAKSETYTGLSHQQYLDRSSGRFYYFDPATHHYYWEDGTPK